MEVYRNARDFRCETCIWGRHCDEDRTWPGSNGPAPLKMWVIPDLLDSATCPLPMIAESSHALLRLHRHYKNGLMPFSGGVLEQPNGYLQAMDIIDDQLARQTADDR